MLGIATSGGLWHLWAFTTPGLEEAEAWFKRAIELEPGLARAHAGRSYVYLLSTWYRDPSRRRELLGKAMEFAKSAVALDERDAVCRFVLGRAKCMTQHYAEAIAELEAAIELNPSFAQGYFALAFTLVWCGREDEAIALSEQAVELSPRDPHLWTFYNARAFAHFSLGELTSAAFFARKGTRTPNATYWPFATLTASLGLSAEREEAEAAAVELLARKPDYNCSFAREDLFFCANKAFINRFGEGLARAGVPA
jgi:tetratricopeptide (TPR) repeat protein